MRQVCKTQYSKFSSESVFRSSHQEKPVIKGGHLFHKTLTGILMPPLAGLNKFARLARSVTRNRTMLQTATPAPLSATTTSITSPQWSLLSPPESAPAGGSVDGRSFSPSPHRSPSPQATNSASTGIDDDLARGDLLSPTPKTPNDLEKGATVS